MSNDAMAGGSKRSLVLLGALAALALNRDTRRALVSGTRQVWQDAGMTLEERVRPALTQAATQAQHRAQELAQEAALRGASTLETLREETPALAQSLLSSARETAGGLAHTAQERAVTLQGRAATLAHEAQEIGGVQSGHARRALGQARKSAEGTLDDVVKPALVQAQGAGLGLLTEVRDRVQDVLGEGADTVEGKRRQVDKTLARARRAAERELLSARREWQPRKLEKAVDRKVAGLHRELGRELKVLEKQARLARRDDRQGGMGGGLVTLALLGAGVVVLARVPAARQGILKAVEGVSPEAAESLHRTSRTIRNVVGSVWMEPLEEPKASPAATAAGQVGTSYGASPPQPTVKEESTDTPAKATASEGKPDAKGQTPSN